MPHRLFLKQAPMNATIPLATTSTTELDLRSGSPKILWAVLTGAFFENLLCKLEGGPCASISTT